MTSTEKPSRILICFFVAVLMIGWRKSSVLTGFEQRFYDLRIRLLSSKECPSPDIVIIGIDDESLARLEPAVGRWPWPRAVFAGLIDYCAKARTVAVDIIFSEADSYYTSSDDLLAAEVGKQNNIIFGLYLNNQTSNSPIPPKVASFALDDSFAPQYPLMEFHSAIIPYPALLEASNGLGHVNYTMDADGVLRYYVLASRLGDKTYPSLVLAAAMKCGDLTPEKIKIDGQGVLQVNHNTIILEDEGKFRFIPPSASYKTYSAAEVLDSWKSEMKGEAPKIKREEFEGKVVFIGSLATGLLADKQVTTGAGNVAGVHIQAAVLDNLLNGKFIKTLSDLGQIIVILTLCFIPLAPNLERPRVMMLVIFSSSFIYLSVIVYCLFFHKLMLPVTVPYLGLFTSSVALGLGYWYKEITHRKKLEVNLRDAYTSLQLTNERLEEYSHTLEAKVDKRTHELKEKNLELESEIAERKRIEKTLVVQADELAVINTKLRSISRHKDQFLANMSHELRTPLNAVLGASELLHEGVQGPLSAKQLRSVQMITDSGQHLLSLINDILDLAKIEEGKIELSVRRISIQSTCEASLQFIKQLAQKKGITITCDYDNKHIKTLHTDERRLKQILVNLLTNAVKFTSEKGRIGLQVTDSTESKQVQFVVWDTGVGISEDDRARLFQPFVQLDSSLKRQHEGTGLGLSLVDRLTKMLGGNVSLESKVGEGSRFTISLPCRRNDQATEKTDIEGEQKKTLTASTSNPKPKQSEKDSKRILLAEDNEATIETLREYLIYNGYEVLVAKNGVTAIAQTAENHPDLILMDIQMPEMDGINAIRRLRSKDEFTELPIIALTALAMPEDREECMKAGANKYFSKPVKLQTLLDTIEDLLIRS